MLAISGPETDIEPKDLGEAHHNPILRPKETQLQGRQDATASQPPEVPDPR